MRAGLSRWALTAFLVAVVMVTFLANRRLERLEGDGREQELLYLPNGKLLKVISLGHSSLMADLVYIWAIQYYSNYERGSRYRYVEHVFGNVIADLDPHYVDPVWIGSMILFVEKQDFEAGLRLLDKGFARNPDQWVLPYLAAMECHRNQQYERAAEYFARAAAIPSAPARMMRMRAGMTQRAGDPREAVQLWLEVIDDERTDAATLAIAERKLRELKAEIDLASLREALERFRTETGGFPSTLDALASTGYLEQVPVDPDRNPYEYDPTSGRVWTEAVRTLGSG